MKIFAGVFLLIMCSCATQNRCARKFPPQMVNTDSVTIKETFRDSMVLIAPDSAWLEAWLECDSSGNVVIGNLNQKISDLLKTNIKLVKDGKKAVITLECVVDSQKIYLHLLERDTTIKKERTVMVPYPVHFKPNLWQVMKLKSWPWMLLLISLVGAYTVAKFYFKLKLPI